MIQFKLIWTEKEELVPLRLALNLACNLTLLSRTPVLNTTLKRSLNSKRPLITLSDSREASQLLWWTKPLPLVLLAPAVTYLRLLLTLAPSKTCLDGLFLRPADPRVPFDLTRTKHTTLALVLDLSRFPKTELLRKRTSVPLAANRLASWEPLRTLCRAAAVWSATIPAGEQNWQSAKCNSNCSALTYIKWPYKKTKGIFFKQL